MGWSEWVQLSGLATPGCSLSGVSGGTSPWAGTSSNAALFLVSAESLGDAEKEGI